MLTTDYVITSVSYKGDGTTKIFTFPFEYLSRSHVKVYYDGIIDATSNYVYNNAHTVEFTIAPAKDAIITIQRETPVKEQWVTWSDGTVIVSDDLNAQNLQLLYKMQEITDPYNINSKEIDEYLKLLRKSIPFPLGRFSVLSDGNLVIDVFGEMPPDILSIDADGNLILDSDDVKTGGIA